MEVMNTLREWLDRLRRGTDEVEAALENVTKPEVDYVPGPGRWTIRQVMAHLTDSEMVGADRFRRVIAEDNPTLVGYDEKLWSEKLDYRRRNPLEDLEVFRRVRAMNWRLLDPLPGAAFERAGVHSERGRVTLLDLLQTYAEHAEAHARQIRANREQFHLQASR
jgi:hypothetical protein